MTDEMANGTMAGGWQGQHLPAISSHTILHLVYPSFRLSAAFWVQFKRDEERILRWWLDRTPDCVGWFVLL